MPDREKVIKGLQEIVDDNWMKTHADWYVSVCSDALSLLKEDCHNCKLECLLQRYDQLKEKYDKLLKEQEAVEPRVSTAEQRCGHCNKVIEMDGWEVCPWCGKPILWEAVGRSVSK